MKAFAKFCSVGWVVAGMAGSAWAQVPTGSMTISGVAAGGGVFDYTITLQNTSGAGINLNDLWYGWTAQAGNTLPSVPTSAGNNLGWQNNIDANSIMFVNSSGTALAPGATGIFTFTSTSDLAAIEGPASDSVAYEHGIDFSQGLSGSSTAIMTPTVVSTPEPTAWSLLGGGLVATIFGARRRLARG